MFLGPRPHRKCQCYYLCGIQVSEKIILIKYCVFVLIGGKYAIMHCPPMLSPQLRNRRRRHEICQMICNCWGKTLPNASNRGNHFQLGNTAQAPIFLVFHFQGILVLLNINQIKDWGRSWDGSWFKPKIILKKDMSENFAGKEYGKMWVWHVQTGALITGLISSTCFETGRMCRKDTNAVIQTLIKSSKSQNRPL